jgi:hypothetical protein
MEVNRKKITGTSDWERAVSDDPGTLVILVQREGQTLFFTYKKQ